MAAPTMDKILPPVLFLIALLTAFVAIVGGMATTIQSNLNEGWDSPGTRGIPDYMRMFTDGTYSIWTPVSYAINDTKIHDDWPLFDTIQTVFENPQEDEHEIEMSAISGYWLGTQDLVNLFFQQEGGWLGLQRYYSWAKYPGDFTEGYDVAGNLVNYKATIYLRHEYLVVLGGYNESSASLDAQIEAWNFNVTLVHSINSTSSASPWTIVGQFFTFNLPGIPQWLSVLIAAPIMVVVAIAAYILIRGALPT